jgi:hypothetical protein
MKGKGKPSSPLHPLRGGAIPWASACDFLGSPCPRKQVQGWCLEGDEEVFEKTTSLISMESLMKLWKQEILSIYEKYKDVFEDEEFLEEFVKILDVANDILTIIERYELPDVVVRTFIEDFYDRLEDFKKYRRYIGRVIEHVCDELRSVVEENIGQYCGEVEGGVIEDD